MIEFGHSSHPGLRRQLNEDTYYGDAELGLWLVADGMGGRGCGEIASALAREAIVRHIRSGASLEAAIRQADVEIIATARQRGDRLPMGTTVVCARINDDQLELAWVGDSRAYLWQEGRLNPLSRDYSYINDLIAKGRIRGEHAHLPPHRQVVTQALGVTDPSHLNVASVRVPWQPGMQLLLCSDGLTEELRPQELTALISTTDCCAQEGVDTLIASALDAGGGDNITAVLIRAH